MASRTRKSRKTGPKAPAVIVSNPISISSLPPELIMSVMEQLRESILTLKHCALVCRSWQFPAQRYLFGHMQLRSSDTCNQMNRVLRSSLHLATHVDTVTIFHTSSFMGLRNATRLMEKLRNVRFLNIVNYSWNGQPWTTDELENVSQLQSVEILRLQEDRDDSLLFRLLETFPNLHSLQLHRSVFGPYPTVSRLQNNSPSRNLVLRSFALPSLESPLNSTLVKLFITPTFDYTNLRSLKMHWRARSDSDMPYFDAVDNLLKKCGQQVFNLSLAFFPPSYSSVPYDALATFFVSRKSMLHFPELKNLSLAFNIDNPPLSFMPSLPQALSLITSFSAHHLQNITLHLFILLTIPLHSKLAKLKDAPEWNALESFLSDSGSLADLQNVEVRLSVGLEESFVTHFHERGDILNMSQEEVEGPIRKELSEIFTDCLPAVNNAGKLRVEIRTIRYLYSPKYWKCFCLWNEGRPQAYLESYV
ncbi:hypothetical protein VKT23_008954 [Stygiomarasmius scandens]|uniref:F-box domain-containing protein n=1 Tax=Marasmiellus scandens TaxID=2682957 RepID=A0ABR1JGX8_9AGAR